MSNFKHGLGALAVFLLALGVDSEAGWRCRQAPCCYTPCASDCCASPSYAPCVNFYDTNNLPCPPGYQCMCCSNQHFVTCQGNTCDPGTMCCVKIGSNIQINCGGYEGGSASQASSMDWPVLWGMIGDDSTKKLRYAYIDDGDTVEVYAPHSFLGRGFTRRPK